MENEKPNKKYIRVTLVEGNGETKSTYMEKIENDVDISRLATNSTNFESLAAWLKDEDGRAKFKHELKVKERIAKLQSTIGQ